MTLDAMIIVTSAPRAQTLGAMAGARSGGLGMTSMTIMTTTWEGGAVGVR